MKIIDALPKTWKDIILKGKGNKELYLILVEVNAVKLTVQHYFEKFFKIFQFNWKKLYFLIRSTTFYARARMFQYKVLHNILCADKMLFKFGKVTSP